jgi:hypothetical protein
MPVFSTMAENGKVVKIICQASFAKLPLTIHVLALPGVR